MSDLMPRALPAAVRSAPTLEAIDIGTRLRVSERHDVAERVLEVVLRRPDGGRLPHWTPGAHIDLMLGNGLTRQYSLCGDPLDPLEYRVSVLLEPSSRGGSAYIHQRLLVGEELEFGGPRNNFPLAPSLKYRFVAGGIGITPILPMARTAKALGAHVEVLYLGRCEESMAHLDRVASVADALTVHTSDDRGELDLTTWLGDFDSEVKLYACGPAGLLDVITRLTSEWTPGWARMERFTARTSSPAARTTSYQVEAAASGVTVTVEAGESIADALRARGVDILTSCGQGVCGTCETRIITGHPDHRDAILDGPERNSNTCMFPCVSRSHSDLLVLDI